ncbi:thioesterase family protein [Hoyosella altamirensis]|uniref:Acyl-coenzyme A thioesterase PaaI-like protein n=1 Tax=Hoyosella altamirensis TaxID=616997 RepID=A0A839RKT4_9ACTN|nr:thioesterase family protein [Hoyosella altamirensis]MBB3036673.1 acyl-coenzyme A thioesterase PaaI-like protein [Hoyosella altamirensis]
MSEFARATLPKRNDRDRYGVTLDGQWSIGDKLHGGYLLAVVARAAAARADEAKPDAHPDVSAISATYVQPPEPGAAEVVTELLRSGRSATQVQARLVQGGATCVSALMTFGALGADDPYWTSSAPVDLPPRERCVRIPVESPGVDTRLSLMGMVEQYIDPAALGFAIGEPSRRGFVGTWVSLADGTAWDPFSMLIALDPSPPVSLEMGIPGWAPTLQLTAFVRRHPAPGPLQVHTSSAEISDDRMDETTTVWDSEGRVVGQAVQLAGVRIPVPAKQRR